MDILDFLTFFIYTGIFYFICLRLSKTCLPGHRKLFISAFWIKVFSSFCYSMFGLYIARGDSVDLYFPEGHNFYKLILKDISNIYLVFQPTENFDESLLMYEHNLGYLRAPNNYMVVRIQALVSFLTFGRFMASQLVFSLLALTGAWRLFLFFDEQFPSLKKQLAIAILFLPTFIFWSSGILKDSICVGALGWLTYSMYHLFYSKKNILLNLCIVLFAGFLLYSLKVYILVSYLPAIALYLILLNVNLVKSKLLKALLAVLFVVVSIMSFVKIAATMKNTLGNFAPDGSVESSIIKLQDSYKWQGGRDEAGSYFSLGVEFDGSVQSLLRMAPSAINATLFRPYLWESKKLSTLLSSLESLMLMLFTLLTLYKCGIKNFFLTIVNKPSVLFCILFSLSFALFVGATTLNFGSLVRYKIPCMPFYVIAIFLILHYNGKIKPKKGKALIKEG
ncbi:MAG: hypothetical protein WAT19_01205 [Ferruginibacter sp.]